MTDQPDRSRSRSWPLRVAVVGGLLALAGELVRTWGQAGQDAQRTVDEILGQSASGPDPATLVGEAMLGVGGAVAVVALLVWLVKRVRS